MLICKAVCGYAAPRVHVQQRVHYARGRLFICRIPLHGVYNFVFICSGPCMCARRRVYLQRAVYIYRASCLICTRLVLVSARAWCLCAGPCVYSRAHARVHGSPDRSFFSLWWIEENQLLNLPQLIEQLFYVANKNGANRTFDTIG